MGWYDVLVFANKLSEKEGLKPAYEISGNTDPAQLGEVPIAANDDRNAVKEVPGANGWRLPTEKEWEYVTKGGNNTAKGYTETNADTYYEYSSSDMVGKVARYSENAENLTREVWKKTANELGLHDISGNMWKWCFDKPIAVNAARVIRGGSWNDSAANVRSADRLNGSPQRTELPHWVPVGALLVPSGSAPKGVCPSVSSASDRA
ncbi:MAG: formylglycine-generating enzyme family protein [Treponema sp.]|nr:formylglycine-generating enzyme family protein [Treponema sp.]